MLDETLKLKVFRPTPDSATFTVVGESEFRDLPGPGPQQFPTRIPVAAGDRIGYTIAPPGAVLALTGCSLFTGNPADVYRNAAGDPAVGSTFVTVGVLQQDTLNIAARVEPDADRDGFGDETQDQCPFDASTQGPCPPAPPAADTSITLSLGAKRKQPVKRLKVKVKCGNEACDAELGGKAVAKKKKGGKERKRASAAKKKKRKKTFKVKPTTFSVPAGGEQTERVRFKKNKKTRRKLRRLLKRGAYRANAMLNVTVNDAAGNAANDAVKVKLRR